MSELKVESVPVDVLVSDPNNARKHDSKNLAAIAKSLELFGQRKPIVVTAGNLVVAGNGTLAAAKSLGWDSILVARTPRDWTAEQVKAFALADNRSAELAEWDDSVLADQLLELDANGWELEDLGFVNLEPPSESDWEGALNPEIGMKGEYRQWTFTLSDRQYEIINGAIKAAGKNVKENTDNENSNANALEIICAQYVG